MNNTRFGCGEAQEFAQIKHDLSNANRLLKATLGALGCVQDSVERLVRVHKWRAYTGFGVPANEAGPAAAVPEFSQYLDLLVNHPVSGASADTSVEEPAGEGVRANLVPQSVPSGTPTVTASDPMPPVQSTRAIYYDTNQLRIVFLSHMSVSIPSKASSVEFRENEGEVLAGRPEKRPRL